MILKTDCKYFPGDRPCDVRKSEGIKCSECKTYSPITFKILIVKLDAAGDVLRTTSILSALKEAYPKSYIAWVTKENARDIFINNSFVDEVLCLEEPEIYFMLTSQEFDLLINVDTSPISSAIAGSIDSKVKKGFILNKLGRVVATDESAVEWLEMSAFDEYKKKNKKSYQQIIHEIAGLEYKKGEILIELTPQERSFRDNFFEKNNLGRYEKLIGLNTGAGGRWQFKQWRFDGFSELVQRLKVNKNIGILLYGGVEEAERNTILAERFGIVNTGSHNSLREFFALVDVCDLMITGDTLALHSATALKKRVICLFGPTSHHEIEDYNNQILKIIPEMDCLVCYKTQCDFKPNCMDLISVDMVFNAIIKNLE